MSAAPSAAAPSPVSPTIPLDADGVHHGHLRLPWSRDDSAWGSVMIPIAVVANGPGPTALFTGANHGDEYEGPIALQALALGLDPATIVGRVIVVPAFNYPAFRAGTRTSPIDRGNLNRSFPGRPDGTVTEKIADFFARTLVPMADLVLDFHSGGRTLDFLPFAACHRLPDPAQDAACAAAVRAFAAPWSMRMVEIDAVGMYDTTVEGQGKVFVTTELGGGGTSTPRSVAVARRGARETGRATGRAPAGHAGVSPRSRSERRRSTSSTVSSAIDSATMIVATARMVGEICSRSPVYICHGSVFWPALPRNSTTTTSSNDVMNANSAPDTTPGTISGICTLKKVRTGSAPRFAAARVSERSKPTSVAVTVMMTNGVPRAACASTMPR